MNNQAHDFNCTCSVCGPVTPRRTSQAEHAIAEIIKANESTMTALDYQDECRQIDNRHLRTIGELIKTLNLKPQVKVFEFGSGFVLEFGRKPEGLEHWHWSTINLKYRPGRLSRHEMAIFMVLGVAWVEFGVDTVTVGL